MTRFIVVAALTVVLTGCFDKGGADEGIKQSFNVLKTIPVANNSPDVTVKTWWKLKDASVAFRIEICKRDQLAAAGLYEKFSQVSVEKIQARPPCKYSVSYDRQITKVEVQSDTRAIVTALIRNSEPPEDGAVLDTSDKKAKEDGEPFQYLLERPDVNSGWKITKISSFPSYAHDWQDIYPKQPPSNNRYVFGYYQ